MSVIRDAPSVRTPPRAEPVRACVQVDGTETWYARWGRGTPIVVLTTGPFEAVALALDESLSASQGVLCPEIPVHRLGPLASDRAESEPGSEDFVRWLRGLLDGLGLESVRLVGSPELKTQIEAFLREDPDRIDGPIVWLSPHN